MASYETLTIDGRGHAKASQTATPNNTPRGTSVCWTTGQKGTRHVALRSNRGHHSHVTLVYIITLVIRTVRNDSYLEARLRRLVK